MAKDTTKSQPNSDRRYQDNIDAYLKSSGFQKVWNYFLDITRTDYFKRFIKKTREKLNIPPNGLTHRNHFTQSEELSEYINSICKEYKLYVPDYSEILYQHILYNKPLEPLMEVGASGLFRINCVVSKNEGLHDDEYQKYSELLQTYDDETYPLAIHISPYASQRDLVDFVKNKAVWGIIKLFQHKYADSSSKIGKIKHKDKKIQSRNDFIYENRDLPRKKIMGLVRERFGESLDYAHIAKIISIENKRRKDVSA